MTQFPRSYRWMTVDLFHGLSLSYRRMTVDNPHVLQAYDSGSFMHYYVFSLWLFYKKERFSTCVDRPNFLHYLSLLPFRSVTPLSLFALPSALWLLLIIFLLSFLLPFRFSLWAFVLSLIRSFCFISMVFGFLIWLELSQYFLSHQLLFYICNLPFFLALLTICYFIYYPLPIELFPGTYWYWLLFKLSMERVGSNPGPR